MFIVGINTPEGQATYHYDLEPYWDMFGVPETKLAPEWDGHSPAEAIRRIGLLAADMHNITLVSDDHCECGMAIDDGWEYCPKCGGRLMA